MRGREKFILRDDRDAGSDAPCFDIKKKPLCGGIPTEVIDKNIGVNKVSHDLRWVAERAQRRRIRRVYVVPRGNPLPNSPAVARTTLGITRPSRRGATTLGEVNFNASNLSSTASTSSSQTPGRKGLIIAEGVYHAVGGIANQMAKRRFSSERAFAGVSNEDIFPVPIRRAGTRKAQSKRNSAATSPFPLLLRFFQRATKTSRDSNHCHRTPQSQLYHRRELQEKFTCENSNKDDLQQVE